MVTKRACGSASATSRNPPDECRYLGASYGAPVAYRFAQMYPERVGSMALAGVARQLPDHALGHGNNAPKRGRAGQIAGPVVPMEP